MNSRNSNSKEDCRSYGSFHHAEENASDVETYKDHCSFGDFDCSYCDSGSLLYTWTTGPGGKLILHG